MRDAQKAERHAHGTRTPFNVDLRVWNGEQFEFDSNRLFGCPAVVVLCVHACTQCRTRVRLAYMLTTDQTGTSKGNRTY